MSNGLDHNKTRQDQTRSNLVWNLETGSILISPVLMSEITETHLATNCLSRFISRKKHNYQINKIGAGFQE